MRSKNIWTLVLMMALFSFALLALPALARHAVPDSSGYVFVDSNEPGPVCTTPFTAISATGTPS